MRRTIRKLRSPEEQRSAASTSSLSSCNEPSSSSPLTSHSSSCINSLPDVSPKSFLRDRLANHIAVEVPEEQESGDSSRSTDGGEEGNSSSGSDEQEEQPPVCEEASSFVKLKRQLEEARHAFRTVLTKNESRKRQASDPLESSTVSVKRKSTKAVKLADTPTSEPDASDTRELQIFEHRLSFKALTKDFSLYSLSRAWIRGSRLIPERSSHEVDREPATSDNFVVRMSDAVKWFSVSDIPDVAALPPAVPTDTRPYLARLPPFSSVTMDGIVESTAPSVASDSKDSWIDRWKSVRREWVNHRQVYKAERFGESLAVLSKMYELNAASTSVKEIVIRPEDSTGFGF